jgi:hypothetical protein
MDFWQYFQLHYQDNVIAGFINSIILGVAAWFLIVKKMLICKETWCFRPGHHKVEGTHYKTCPKHTTKEIHDKWKIQHKKDYPEAHKFLKEGK